MLTPTDYIAIALYILALLWIGYRASRNESADAFLISERKMGTLAAVSTINATKTGSIILLYTTMLYDYGLSALWYFIGVVVGYCTFVPFAKKLFAQSNGRYYTLAEYFLHNYGRLPSYATSAASIIIMLGFLTSNLIAAATVVAFFSPASFLSAIIFVSLFVYLYLIMAGFRAVVRTDIFQYIAIVFILILFLFPLSTGTQIPAAEWNMTKAGPGNIFGFILFGILIPFASPDLWQRVYAMPSLKDVSRSIYYSIAIYIPVCIVLSLVGLLIKSHLPGIDPNIALVEGLSQLLPAGMRGLSLVVFFAAFMSSIDTYAFTATSCIVQDFNKKISKAQTVKYMRYMLTAIMLFALVAAISIRGLLDAAFIFAGFYVIIAIPTIASAIKPSIRKETIMTSLIGGLAMIAIFVPLGLATRNITPLLSMQIMTGSLMGLGIGGVIRTIKKS